MSHPTPSAGHGHQPSVFDATSKLVALAIGLIAVIAGLLIGINNPFLTRAASVEGSRIDALFGMTLGIGTAIFVVVQGFLLYSVVRFGQEPGDETDGPPIRGNTRLEFFWTAIPAVIIVVIGLLSYRVLADIEQPAADEMVVEVKGLQYAWQFYYPEHDITSSELHIPLDQQVLLRLRSNDVIHSFWVPEFRIKKDAMPDRITETRITGTEPGAYPIVCTELCGAGHAVMRSQVVVQSDGDYRAWVASMKQASIAAAAGAPDPLAAGRQLFVTAGCNACHILADARAVGPLGPKLDGIGTRAGSTVPGQSAEEYVRASIVQPGAHMVPDYPDIMPKDYELRIPAADLDVLVEYLLEMK
jgi:cytochrome c oxidase subunit 2